jgi:hypothetical protein
MLVSDQLAHGVVSTPWLRVMIVMHPVTTVDRNREISVEPVVSHLGSRVNTAIDRAQETSTMSGC